MNKLIIAGNGFDLAHGLPTHYNHFMDAFWRDLKDDFEDELVSKVVYINPRYKDIFKLDKISNYKSFKAEIKRVVEEKKLHEYSSGNSKLIVREIYSDDKRSRLFFEIHNDFFRELNEIHSIQNWVDVENEYYQTLKIICKDEKLGTRQKREKVVNLHKEFEEVKQLLERYLQKNVVETYDFTYINQQNSSDVFDSLEPFKYKTELTNRLKSYKEFSDLKDQDEILNPKPKDSKKKLFDFNSLILNFNYTPTLMMYSYLSLKDKQKLLVVNHIHSSLNKEIVFGFGDEMDEDYKLIENIDDNEYLRYFKSFQYVQNSNYKDILRYVDSEKFQVIIMGHSCGLSDRTLLNTIFEHDNCRSIKVFYHQKDDGTDNYTEVIQNISRHFNDKKLMRTKIVEKTLCEPMPQIQLPRKT